MQAFEKEGIQTITALKDQLIASNHEQTKAIEKRYSDVISRLLFCCSVTFLLEVSLNQLSQTLENIYEFFPVG